MVKKGCMIILKIFIPLNGSNSLLIPIAERKILPDKKKQDYQCINVHTSLKRKLTKKELNSQQNDSMTPYKP